jgi:type IV pilus assembly protein PilM
MVSAETSEGEGLSEPSRKRSSGKETELLVVAVTNELINRYYEIAKLSGFRLKYLELDTFSMARSLVRERGENTLIIDIGSHGTLLAIVANGWPVFTRTIDVAGLEFSKILASSLGIDFARAEKLKVERGLDAGGGTLIPLIDSIVLEGKQVMNEFTQRTGKPVQKVVVSGGSAQMPGVLRHVFKTMGRASVIALPFRGIIYPEVLESTLRDRGPSFAVAIGLALREFT